MTSRLLLTLLALLTGLSAQGSPVEARALAVQRAEIGTVATVAEVRQARLAASLPATVSNRFETGGEAISRLLPYDEARSPAKVQIGIDRARE